MVAKINFPRVVCVCASGRCHSIPPLLRSVVQYIHEGFLLHTRSSSELSKFRCLAHKYRDVRGCCHAHIHSDDVVEIVVVVSCIKRSNKKFHKGNEHTFFLPSTSLFLLLFLQ